MAKLGHNVIYIPIPVTPFHLIKLKRSNTRIRNSGKLIEVQKNLSQFIPQTFIPTGELTSSSGYDLAFINFSKKIKSIMKAKNIKQFDLIFMDHPKLFGITHLVSYKKLIYRPTDILTGIGLRGIKKCEKLALDNAHGLITTSKPVFEHLKSNFNINIPHLTLVNGVDLELFTAPAPPPDDIKTISGKKCIYVGAFDDRFDFEGTLQIIKDNSDINFILIGPFPSSKMEEFKQFNNAYILGARDFSKIPAYMQACDVSIMPFSDAPSNEGRSPMKLYEFLAAGIPVVSRYTDEINRRSHSRIFTYNNIPEASTKLREALKLEKCSSASEHLSWKSITREALGFAIALK